MPTQDDPRFGPIESDREVPVPEGAADSGMASPLRELLIAVVPRERSGSRMTNRVEYQKHWALTEVLARHEKTGDYCFVFEHHDDVMVLDSDTTPTRAQFYQIKTKNRGEWKLTELLARERPSDPASLSILGKMFVHKRNFPTHTVALTFVSNVPCLAKLANGSGVAGDRDLVCVSELTNEERDRILAQLKTEHGDAVVAGDSDLFFLAHCDLALRNTEDHGVGKLERFLGTLFPGRRLAVRAIYQALLGEISRRSGHEDIPSSFEQLIEERSLCRANVDQFLRTAGVPHDPDINWGILLPTLNTLGWGPGKVRRVHLKWSMYEIERMNPENLPLQRMRDEICAAVADFVRQEEAPVREMLDDVGRALASSNTFEVALLGQDYIDAMTLFEYMEAYEEQFPAPNPAVAEETA